MIFIGSPNLGVSPCPLNGQAAVVILMLFQVVNKESLSLLKVLENMASTAESEPLMVGQVRFPVSAFSLDFSRTLV